MFAGAHKFPMEIYIDLQSKCSVVLVAYLNCLWSCISSFGLCLCEVSVCHYTSKNMRQLKTAIFRLLAALWFGVRTLCNGARLLI